MPGRINLFVGLLCFLDCILNPPPGNSKLQLGSEPLISPCKRTSGFKASLLEIKKNFFNFILNKKQKLQSIFRWLFSIFILWDVGKCGKCVHTATTQGTLSCGPQNTPNQRRKVLEPPQTYPQGRAPVAMVIDQCFPTRLPRMGYKCAIDTHGWTFL